MSKDTAKFTEQFSRQEVNWWYRHLQNEKMKHDKRILKLEGAGKVLSNAQHDELGKLKTFAEELSRFIVLLGDARTNADQYKHSLLLQKEIIEEAISFIPSFSDDPTEDPELHAHGEEVKSQEEIAADRQRLAAAADLMELSMALQKAETIKLTLNRPVIKFVLKLVEQDLHKFRSEIIPKYEKASPDEFKDSPSYMGKEYWVKKSTKAKEMLEGFKRKLEKGL